MCAPVTADTVDEMNLDLTTRSSWSQRGTVLVEFALLLPFLFLLTFLVVDISRAFGFKNIVTQAAREGARYAVVQPTSASVDSLRARAARRAQGILGTQYNSCSVTLLGDNNLQVTVGGTFNWLYPGLIKWLGIRNLTNPDTLSSTTVMRREG